MSTEPTTPPVARAIEGDYQLTWSRDGIKIEVLDYHADPLWLTDEVLEKLGIAVVRSKNSAVDDA